SQCAGNSLGDLGFARARLALKEQGPPQPQSKKQRRCKRAATYIALCRQQFLHVLNITDLIHRAAPFRMPVLLPVAFFILKGWWRPVQQSRAFISNLISRYRSCFQRCLSCKKTQRAASASPRSAGLTCSAGV